MLQPVSNINCSFALSLIRTLQVETQPNEGHSTPSEVKDRWIILNDIVSRMAEQIQPGSGKDAKLLFEPNELVESLPF